MQSSRSASLGAKPRGAGYTSQKRVTERAKRSEWCLFVIAQKTENLTIQQKQKPHPGENNMRETRKGRGGRPYRKQIHKGKEVVAND